MALPSHNSILRLVVPIVVILSCTLLNNSCRRSTKEPFQPQNATSKNLHWYKQAVVDLGYRIVLSSVNEGLAVSRGMGKDVKGKAYRLQSGEWIPFYDYAYSDFPLISSVNSSGIWTINHLVHNGSYRPVHSIFREGSRKEIPLPRIMWDEVDYVMFKGMQLLEDGTAWMVGQQGHILFYDRFQWKEIKSPLISQSQENVYAGDLNDISMTTQSSGWAVGRNGAVIRYHNGHWAKVVSPTDKNLNKLSMVDDSTGWAVGYGGTILQCLNYQWRIVETDIREQLFSVKALDRNNAWIVGNNSTLLSFNGREWMIDESIKTYDDQFADISAVRDSTGNIFLWIIGNQGIYTTYQSIGFSFTDITGESGLRRVGRLGHFFFQSHSSLPDALIANDGGIGLLYNNFGSNIFADVTAETELIDAPRDASIIALGDVNNDGEQDMLQIIDHKNFSFYLGTSSGRYRNYTVRSGLHFDEINSLAQNAAAFVDLNVDGNLDIYLSNYDLPDQILLGNGTGSFLRWRDSTGIRKIEGHASYGAVIADVNNDRLPDILIPYYVSLKKKFFSLFLNGGGMKFVEKENPVFSSTADLAPTAITSSDYNNDGHLDLFIFSTKVPPMLWINDGNGNFSNVSVSVGLETFVGHAEPINGIVGSADVNNDGWMDVYAGTKLYLNSPQFQYHEVSERVGIQFAGTPTFVDSDDDGDLDLYIGSSRESLGRGDRAALFRNNLDKRNFVKFRLTGTVSNRSAVGAKIILTDNAGNKQVRWIGLGGSQLVSQHLHEVHFGVDTSQYFSAEITFPSGTTKKIKDIRAGSTVTVSESDVVSGWLLSILRSIQRTGRLLSTMKLLWYSLLLIIVLGALLLSIKLLSVPNHFPAAVLTIITVLLYLILLHVTIYEREILSSLILLGGTLFISGTVMLMMRSVYRKREERHISHYRILELIGTGGMGKVYKAVDTMSKKVVALKVLHPELLNDPENRRRLSAEGHLLSTFHHPHIVKVYEVGESHGRGFIAMEYLNGGTVKERLNREHPLPLEQIKKIILQVCDGLTEVHNKGIIHRDLKTGNLMHDANGNIRIMDFGLSKSPLVTTMTSLGTVLGTLGYVAPEQVTSLNVDRRTDIFSLGVIMYELMTNELPFKGENEIALIHSIFNTMPPLPTQLRNDLSKPWDEVVMKCLAKDMTDRYSTVQDVSSKIHNL